MTIDQFIAELLVEKLRVLSGEVFSNPVRISSTEGRPPPAGPLLPPLKLLLLLPPWLVEPLMSVLLEHASESGINRAKNAAKISFSFMSRVPAVGVPDS